MQKFFRDIYGKLGFNRMRFSEMVFSKMSYFSGESEIEFFRDIFDFFALRFSFTPTNRRRTPTPTTTPHRSCSRGIGLSRSSPAPTLTPRSS